VRRTLSRWLLEPERPTIALEVRPSSLGVASLTDDRGRLVLGAVASLDLPDGALQLSVTQANVADPEAFGRVLAMLLERAGLKGRRKVGLVLPDPVARIALFPAVELQEKGATVEDMVRFRLRKVVPFDIKDARIASHLGSAPSEPPSHLVAAISQAVLRSYEDVLASQGLEPGLVELAGLALAEAAVGGPGDRLLVNWDHGYVSFLLARSGWPILIRTLTGPAAEADGIGREAAQTLVYYRERLGGKGLAKAVVRAGALPVAEAVAILTEPLGLVPEAIDPWAFVGGGPRDLVSEQGLAGALACLRRAAA
jgi:type IV pilus assembly protein PilM